MSRLLALLSLLLAGCLALAQAPASVNIPIQNPSFDEGEAGWQFGAGSRVVQVNGVNVAEAGYGSSFSQTLTTTPAQLQEYRPGYALDGVYLLKFNVVNYFPTYPGEYDVTLSFGTQQLCESYGWGTHAWTQVTMVCPSPEHLVIGNHEPSGGPAQGTSPLVVTFQVNGWQLLFDNVSLTFQ